MSTGKVALILLLLLVLVIPFSWFTTIFPIQSASSFFRNISSWVDSSVIKQFPQDLVISVKNGQVSLNRPTPYCLILKQGGLFGVVFDPQSEPKIQAFENEGPYSKICQPIAVVGGNYVMTLDKDQIRIQKISPQVTFDINQKNISNLAANYLPKLISFGQTAYLVLPFILIIPAFLFFLLNNLWYSFASGLVLKIFKLRPSNTYGTTLFFYTVINFIQWVIVGYILNSLLKQNIKISFPFLNTILIAIASVFYFKSKSVPPEITPLPNPGTNSLDTAKTPSTPISGSDTNSKNLPLFPPGNDRSPEPHPE